MPEVKCQSATATHGPKCQSANSGFGRLSPLTPRLSPLISRLPPNGPADALAGAVSLEMNGWRRLAAVEVLERVVEVPLRVEVRDTRQWVWNGPRPTACLKRIQD